MESVAVVHLVRFANGPYPVEGFFRNYEKCTLPDSRHRLVLACKGFEDFAHLTACLAEWSPIANTADQKMLFPDQGFDLGTYRRAAAALQDDVLVFANSFSRPQARGWVERLAAALQNDVGIVGATGSFEAVPSTTFPNPHVRTNAFAIRRKLLLELEWPEPVDKHSCWMLESGPGGITRQITAKGLRAVVVGAKGEPADLSAARLTRTFRWGRQDNLMVADTQTDDNARQDRHSYASRQRASWGRVEMSSEIPPLPPPLPPPYVPAKTRDAEVLFICPIYDMYPQIISSLICQTHPNWRLFLLHNGPADGGGPRFPYRRIQEIVDGYADRRVSLRSFPTEQGKWGHPLRQWALNELRQGKLAKLPKDKNQYVVVTNADNYYMPGFTERLLGAFQQKPSAVAAYCQQMIHSYLLPVGHRWSVFDCRPEQNHIDCGGVMVKAEEAGMVGWNSHAFASDWEYFADLQKAYGRDKWVGVPGCLFVHN